MTVNTHTPSRWHHLGRALAAAALLAMVAGNDSAPAQSWPDRTVTIIVPFAAGGGADVSTRIMAEHFSASLGQSFIVENVAGAGGATGSLRGKNAKPDGYTIGFGHMGTHAAAVATNTKLPYDPRTDFDYIGIHTTSPSMMIVRKDFPADTLQDFVAYAKEKGKGLKMAHNGAGSLSHLTCVVFFGLIGVEPTYVVYRGFGQIINDILSGAVDGTCDFVVSARNHVNGGSVKAYGVAAPERSPLLPQVPTAREGGVPDFELIAWLGLYAPKNLPPGVLPRLREAYARALDDPTVQKKLNDIGGEVPKPDDRGGQRMLEIIKRDIDRWGEVVKKIGGIKEEGK